jgi:hypothetical protein
VSLLQTTVLITILSIGVAGLAGAARVLLRSRARLRPAPSPSPHTRARTPRPKGYGPPVLTPQTGVPATDAGPNGVERAEQEHPGH